MRSVRSSCRGCGEAHSDPPVPLSSGGTGGTRGTDPQGFKPELSPIPLPLLAPKELVCPYFISIPFCWQQQGVTQSPVAVSARDVSKRGVPGHSLTHRPCDTFLSQLLTGPGCEAAAGAGWQLLTHNQHQEAETASAAASLPQGAQVMEGDPDGAVQRERKAAALLCGRLLSLGCWILSSSLVPFPGPFTLCSWLKLKKGVMFR